MDIIVVNDTNIFIDLISVGLLDDFFHLPIEIHTTDFVLNELTDESQSAAVWRHVNSKHLTVKRYSGTEVAEIVSFQAVVITMFPLRTVPYGCTPRIMAIHF